MVAKVRTFFETNEESKKQSSYIYTYLISINPAQQKFHRDWLSIHFFYYHCIMVDFTLMQLAKVVLPREVLEYFSFFFRRFRRFRRISRNADKHRAYA